jgi:type VI secretion system protein ImpA
MEELDTKAKLYFLDLLNIELDSLLAPFAGASVAGESLVGSATYVAIRSAREEEDASLPMGAWERELKRADWSAVSRLCVQALVTQSKDLQLAAWLMEAEIHRSGFRALAPCLSLLGRLSQTYWQEMYPLDAEHRDNIFRWMADKLRLPLRRIPFTSTGSGADYGWADWEQAQRNEQIRAALGRGAEQSIEGTTLTMFSAALACTPAPDIIAVQDQLAAAQSALALLDTALVAQLGHDAPILDPLRDLIENIALMLASEARKRGLSRSEAPAAEAGVDDSVIAPETITCAGTFPAGTDERTRLYSALSQIADQLARLEPHSPVPYLIRRAVDWGRLNTAQLYNEVFVRCSGQINIFELLGLEEQIAAQEESPS